MKLQNPFSCGFVSPHKCFLPVGLLLFAAALIFPSASKTGFSSSFLLSTWHILPTEKNLITYHDPSSCWSRQEQHSHRQTGKNYLSPPPKFLQMIRAYEQMHARCTKDVPNWTLHLKGHDGHNGVAPSYVGTKHEGCQYLVYRRGSGGLGNRLLSLSSAFLLSLLTHRALLIPVKDWDLRMLCDPFHGSSWWADVHSDFLLKEPVTMEDFLKDPSGRQSVFVDLDVWAPRQFSGAVYCDDVQLALRNVTWLSFQSDTWIAPSLHLSTVLRSKMVDLFPDNLVFPHVARYLLNPNNEIWDYVQRIYAAYFQNADRRIGIQEWGPHSGVSAMRF